MQVHISSIERVTHLEEDLFSPFQVVISTTTSISLLNFQSLRFTNLVGTLNQKGYREGIGTKALFQEITGFAQVNEDTLLVIDYKSNCIRRVNRQTIETSRYIGRCDGTKETFTKILKIVADRTANVCYMSDFGAIYRLWPNKTLQELGRKNSYDSYVAMTLDTAAKNLYMMTYYDQLVRFNIDDRTFLEITAKNTTGFQDGPLSEALFNFPESIIHINDEILLIADSLNNRVRVVGSDKVSSICKDNVFGIVRDDNISNCLFNTPRALAYLPKLSVVVIGTNPHLHIMCINNSMYIISFYVFCVL